MKKILWLVVSLVAVFSLAACDATPVAGSTVDKTALISLLNDFELIPQTLDQATLVTAYTLVLENEEATQKEVNQAVAGLKELKETIFSTPMSFIDGGLEPYVREALGLKDPDVLITQGDCFSLTELDCTYSESFGQKIRVSYDFRYFPNLKSLDLSGNDLQELNGFAYLVKLENLSLEDNPVRGSTLNSEDSAEDFRSLEILASLPLKTLDLSGSGVLPSLSVLPRMESLISLDISGNSLADLNDLGKKCPFLESLTITDASIQDASGLSSCTSLKILDLSRTAVSDLSFLSQMTGLTSFTQNGVLVTDYASLTKTAQLSYLSLSSCGISDLSWLSGFKNLTELDLSRNMITDMSAVLGIASIQKVNLSENGLTSFTLTEFWSQVTDLNLSKNAITSFSVDATCGDCTLKVLDLSENQISSFSLDTAVPLESLNLSSNALTSFVLKSDTLCTLSLTNNNLSSLTLDIPTLATLNLAGEHAFASLSLNLPSLTMLDLSKPFTSVSDVLCFFPQLETLSVHLSGISSQSISSLQKLKTLTVIGGDDAVLASLGTIATLESLTVISSDMEVPHISNLPQLKTLVFRGCNELSDLSQLSDLPALEVLSVTSGNLQTPVLTDLPRLNYLVFADCNLVSLASLPELPSLERLSLKDNALAQIEVFGFSHLQYLDLSNNSFSSTKAIAIDMTRGTLDLSGNPESLYSTLSYPEAIKVITDSD